jgi:hypothetical protein
LLPLMDFPAHPVAGAKIASLLGLPFPTGVLKCTMAGDAKIGRYVDDLSVARKSFERAIADWTPQTHWMVLMLILQESHKIATLFGGEKVFRVRVTWV